MGLLLAAGILWWCGRGGAQFFHQPLLSFEPMTLDLVHRGTFNMSYCSRELLNCWEIIKPDHMCGATDNLNIWDFKQIIVTAHQWPVYESVCGIKREYCDDIMHDQDEYAHAFGLFENYCHEPYEVLESLGRRSGRVSSAGGRAHVTTGEAVIKSGAVSKVKRVSMLGAVSKSGAVSKVEPDSISGAVSKVERVSMMGAVSKSGTVSKVEPDSQSGAVSKVERVSMLGSVSKSAAVSTLEPDSKSGAVSKVERFSMLGPVSKSGAVSKVEPVSKSGAVTKLEPVPKSIAVSKVDPASKSGAVSKVAPVSEMRAVTYSE